MREYFLNKNYTLLYLHVFGDKIGNRLLELFTGVFFYTLGMPLPLIFLFFAFEFGLRGVLAPLAPFLSHHVGVRKTMALSYVFLVIFFLMAYSARFSLTLGFFSFTFQALSRAMYYPCADTLHSVLIHDGSRGRQYTLEIVWSIVAGVLAVGIGSAALAHAFLPAALGIGLVLALALVPVLYMEIPSVASVTSFFAPYQYLASREWRENILPIGAESFAIIANVIIAPVFIFTLVGTSSAFSTIILVGFAIEAILVLVYGAWVDRRGNKETLGVAGMLQGAGNVGYLLAPHIPSFLPFLNGFNNIAWDMFSSNYNTRIQQKAHKSVHPLLFNTASQMTLCFVEIIALSVFAFVAWLWGAMAFIAVFASSIVGLYVATKFFID
jgi:MFS family permease